MCEEKERTIRESLKDFCCKDVEDIIISYIIDRCFVCNNKGIDLHKSYNYTGFLYDEFIDVCSVCLKNNKYMLCIKCNHNSITDNCWFIGKDPICVNCLTYYPDCWSLN